MSSTAKSIVFALITALACSFLLTAASAGLRGFQQENVEVDQKKNILKAVGLVREDAAYSKGAVRQLYGDNIQALHITSEGTIIDAANPVENALPVYVYVKNDAIEAYIIPINSRGLWGRIMGYLALEKDGSTIAGFTVYKHNETPGLGGEIEKRWFQRNFEGKKILDKHGHFVSIAIAKGAVSPSLPEEKRPNYVDGISGATLTGKYLSAGLKATLLDYEPISVKFRTQQFFRFKKDLSQRKVDR